MTTTAVPATRTVRGIPTEVVLDGSDGMPGECALTLDTLANLRVGLRTERITRLGDHRMREGGEALARATAC